MTDRLSPTLALTPAERTEARRIVAADPGAMEPAIRAALCLDDGERTLARMLTLIREVTPCAIS